MGRPGTTLSALLGQLCGRCHRRATDFLGGRTYRDLLSHIAWYRKRQRIIARNGGKCGVCESTRLLEVDHRLYESPIPWETRDGYLHTLCRGHHKEISELRKLIERRIASFDGEVHWFVLVRINALLVAIRMMLFPDEHPVLFDYRQSEADNRALATLNAADAIASAFFGCVPGTETVARYIADGPTTGRSVAYALAECGLPKHSPARAVIAAPFAPKKFGGRS